MGAVVAGEVQFQFSNPISSGPLARAGKLRALGTGGTRRLLTMPELPTISESGIPGFQAGPWFGSFAPAATPRAPPVLGASSLSCTNTRSTSEL